MKIVWDERKRLANLDKHGLDFSDLTVDFFLAAVVRPAKLGRLMAIGRLNDGTIAVIFLRLGSEGFRSFPCGRQGERKGSWQMDHKKTDRIEGFQEGRGYTKEDWDDVSDNPEWTEEDFRKARPFAEVFPDLADSIRRSRGRPAVDQPKRQISLRLDPDVIDAFKATGKGWQGRINAALRKAAKL